MWAKLVHFDVKAQKSNKHSEELMTLFADMVYPTEAPLGFEERIRKLREAGSNR